MKDFSRFIQKASPQSLPIHHPAPGWDTTPALGFCPSGAHYPMGQKIQEILPPSVPPPSSLEAQRKTPPGTGSCRNGTESRCFGVWCLLGDTAPAPGHPGVDTEPPNSVTVAPWAQWGQGGPAHAQVLGDASPWQSQNHTWAGESCRQGPSCPHLLLTNFLVTALGLRRRRPAPRAASRRCRCAARLCTSFSANGDAPAR